MCINFKGKSDISFVRYIRSVNLLSLDRGYPRFVCMQINYVHKKWKHPFHPVKTNTSPSLWYKDWLWGKRRTKIYLLKYFISKHTIYHRSNILVYKLIQAVKYKNQKIKIKTFLYYEYGYTVNICLYNQLITIIMFRN